MHIHTPMYILTRMIVCTHTQTHTHSHCYTWISFWANWVIHLLSMCIFISWSRFCSMGNSLHLPWQSAALSVQLINNFLLFSDSSSKACDSLALDEMRRRLIGWFHLLHGKAHHHHHGSHQHHKLHRHLSVKKELRGAGDGELEIWLLFFFFFSPFLFLFFVYFYNSDICYSCCSKLLQLLIGESLNQHSCSEFMWCAVTLNLVIFHECSVIWLCESNNPNYS